MEKGIIIVEMKKIIGIYFLFNGENVCYIGQSTNIFNRIADHSRDKTFTHYGYIECGEAELNDFEKKMKLENGITSLKKRKMEILLLVK